MTGEPASNSLITTALWLLQSGGFVVAVLLVLSVFALAIILAKLLQFRAAGLWDRQASVEALSLVRAGHANRALAMAAGSAHPAAQALARPPPRRPPRRPRPPTARTP